jgi:tRNA(Ile)-lysidine synthase
MDISGKLLQAVTQYELWQPGDRVLIGVSGGQDSVALAWLMAQLAASESLTLALGHLHHGLRGEEADRDQALVEALAARLELPLEVARADVRALAEANGWSLELAGRQARYDFFERLATTGSYQRVALAHTATDRAETLLLNLFRGTGLAGLGSIPPRRDRIIRPLILVTRQETADLCRTEGLAYASDACNEDLTAARNRLRLQVMPELERQFGPGVEAALCRAAEHVRAEVQWTEPLVGQALQEATGPEGLAVEALREMPPGLRQRVWRAYLQACGHPLTEVGTTHWQAVEGLLQSGRTGQRTELPDGWIVEITYGRLCCRRAVEPPGPVWVESLALAVPGEVTLPDGRVVRAELSASRPPLPSAGGPVAVLDAGQTGEALEVRLARPGDRLQPLGMRGHKKLQDLLVDGKVPREARQVLVVTGREGEVLWVVGHRLSQQAAVRAETNNYLLLSVTKQSEAPRTESRGGRTVDS